MKVVILTSDILDGVIISQRILRSGQDVKAIIYESKKQTVRSVLKRVLFRIKGTIRYLTFEGMIRFAGKDIVVKKVDNINCDSTKEILRKVEPDIMTVIGTGKIEEGVFASSRMGTINMHSGILPYYRGADSEFWALFNGEQDRIGVTIHFIDKGLDTGDIISRTQQKVIPGDDHRSLRMKNIILGAEKMVEALDFIESGEFERIPQDNSVAKTYKSASLEEKEAFAKRRSREVRGVRFKKT